MASIIDIFTLLSYLWILLRTKLHILHLRLSGAINRFYTLRVVKQKAKTNPIHTIAIIGDGTAAGLGDTGLSLGGTAGLGVGIINRVYTTKEIRRRWAVVNAGVVGSTCEDWDPRTGDGGLFGRSFGGGKVDSTADTSLVSAVKGSQIIVLSLGITDVIRGSHGFKIQSLGRDPMGTEPTYPETELADCVVRLREVWRRVRGMGKRVVVVGFLPSGAFIER